MNRRQAFKYACGAAAAYAAWELFKPPSGLSVSLWPAMSRRIGGVGTVSSGAVNRQIPQDEYVSTCRKYQQEATTNLTMPHVVNGLWKTEGFSTTFGKYRLPDNTLNDPRIPRESLGIAHVGYGAASTEFSRFDPAKLNEIADTKCNPNFKLLMLEGAGSILRIYEPGLFKQMCSMMGLIPKDAPDGPDSTGFFKQFLSAFPDEVQWLMTHGYGRMMAFSKMSVASAIDEARALPAGRQAPAVQGIAFAFAMMNSQDMARILENSSTVDFQRPAFQNGLIYALVFCDWFVPGFLAAWKPAGDLEGKLVSRAAAESAENLKRGHPLAFRLQDPVTA